MSLIIDKDPGNFLILFRPEMQTTISWGGNPEEAVRFEADKKTYHPRNSFMLFKETINQTSSDWLPEEVKMARELRNFLFEYTIKSSQY